MNRPGKYGVNPRNVTSAEYMRAVRAGMPSAKREEERRKTRERVRAMRARDRDEPLPDHVQAGMDLVLAKIRRGAK